MKKATKALLFSALLFPGSGYLVIKKFPQAFVAMGITLASLIYIINTLMVMVNRIVEKVLNGQLAPDVASLTRTIEATLQQTDGTMMTIASYLLLICWLGSAVDCYRLGEKMDNQAQS